MLKEIHPSNCAVIYSAGIHHPAHDASDWCYAEPAQHHIRCERTALAPDSLRLLLDDAVRLSEALAFPWQPDDGIDLLAQKTLKGIALHGQEDTARVIVKTSNIIIADNVLRTIVSPDAERLWHIGLGVADVVSRTGRAEIALMQSIEFLLRRIAAPLHPALQDADRPVVKGQRLIPHMLQGQGPVAMEDIFVMKVMLMAVDVDISRMAVLRRMREENPDALQRHRHRVDNEIKTRFHVVRRRLLVMIAAHQDLMAGQLHEAHELLLIPRHITKMDQRVITPDHLTAVVEDEVRESRRTTAALEHILMAQMRIRDQVKHCLSPHSPQRQIHITAIIHDCMGPLPHLLALRVERVMKKVVALDVQGLLTSVEQQLAADLHVEDIGMKASSLSWTMPTNTSSPVMTSNTTPPPRLVRHELGKGGYPRHFPAETQR